MQLTGSSAGADHYAIMGCHIKFLNVRAVILDVFWDMLLTLKRIQSHHVPVGNPSTVMKTFSLRQCCIVKHRCIFIFKCVNGLIDFDFKLTTNNNIHSHNTRTSKNLHLPKANINLGKQKLTYQASNDFNNLDNTIKKKNNIYLFIYIALFPIHCPIALYKNSKISCHYIVVAYKELKVA